jgi:uncharacterized LabA/DUF88 family protein
MQRPNFAFIDSQNVHLAIRDQGWSLDWRRFRRYQQDKYHVEKAFAFIGYVPGKETLYTALQNAGFVLIFKPTLEIRRGPVRITKGNVDAELVLHTMIEWDNYDKAIIVSGDGDFHCLVDHLLQKNKLLRLMIPNPRKFSALLRSFRTHIAYMDTLRMKIGQDDRSQKNEREYPSDEP